MTSDIGPAITILAADTKLVEPVASGWQLILAALAGIALIVVLITVAKLHPFLALIFGAITVGVVAGQNPGDVLDSFGKGFGDTAASVGILIALGAMFAKLLADSGGADEIVDTIIGRASPRALPWAMALVGAIIGLPMFFEIGLVLLMPVIFLVSRRSGLPLMKIGIPALAGLSAMHGFVPPHPGPLVAVAALHANLGITLGLGVLVAVPSIIIAGPLFARFAARWVPVEAPELFDGEREPDSGGGVATERRTQLLDVTTEVETAVGGSDGALATLFVPHTTAGILLQAAGPGASAVATDIEAALERLVDEGWPWGHVDEGDRNPWSHVRTALTASSVSIPLGVGKLALGGHQAIFLAEFDGPRERKIYVKVLPDRV